MRRLRPLTALFALAIAASAADLVQAASTAPLPLGTDGHGVRLVQRGAPAHLVVLLSPKRYRVVAGRQVTIVCAPVPPATLGGILATGPRTHLGRHLLPPGGVSVHLHAPRHRAPLVTRLSPSWDWCSIARRVYDHRVHLAFNRSFATVPLTPAGAAFADERRIADRVITAALALKLGREAIGIGVRRAARILHAAVLASPTETPPPRRLGLYSDGRRHDYAAQIDRAGDLLLYEQDGDVTRTNLLRYLQDPLLLWGADPFS